MRYWKVGMLMDVIGHPGTEIEMPPDRIGEQNALATTAWLNEAMCYIRMAQNEEETGLNYKGFPTNSTSSPELWRKAIASCDVAMKFDADSVKAHYRKGLAFLHLHEFSNAKWHFDTAAKGEPGNREIRAAIERCRLSSAAANESDKRMYQKVIRQSKGLYSEKPVSGLIG